MKPRPISYLRGLSCLPAGMASQVKKYCIVVIVALALIALLYPSAFIYPKDTLPDNNDTRLIAYIIGQVQKNLLTHQPLHYGTFFVPDQNTLAYSDLFLTSALVTIPFRLFINHPIVIFNIALVIGFVLTILTSFTLFEYLFKDFWVTTLAVFLFNFSGFHLHYLPHLQMFSLWPLLLSLYLFLRYLAENRLLFLRLFFLTVTLQLAESIFPVYLIFFVVITLLLSSPTRPCLPAGRTLLAGQLKKILYFSLPFVPVWIYLLFPYYQLHISLPEATRPIRDAAHFSLGLDQIFTQFHSWTIIVLFLISTFLGQKQNAAEGQAKGRAERIHPRKRGKEVEHVLLRTSKQFVFEISRTVKPIIFDPWNIIFFFSIIMSLGPVLKIFGSNLRIFGLPIPLPYALFYYLFPGFTGFRTPSRFIILALLAAVIIVGYNTKPFFEKLKSQTKIIFLLLVLSLLFLEADLPLKGYPININMHPVYQQVKSLPPIAVILELPIKLWNMPDHEIESIRSLYSLDHNHRRLGGYSGFATNAWIELVQLIDLYGLSPDNLVRLHALGITHVINQNVLSPLP